MHSSVRPMRRRCRAGTVPGVYAPGWYPDPTGRFEYRYHDGARWTGDVATGGRRAVDPLGGSPTAPPVGPSGSAHGGRPTGNGMAIAALTCGLVGLALAWVPVLFVLGAVLAVLAITFGAIALGRARARGHGRGFAIAGLVTGLAGVALSVVGVWFTVAVFRAVERFESPEAHALGAVVCEVAEGRVDGSGTIENLGDRPAGYTITVEIRRAGSGIPLTSIDVEVRDLEPGAEETFRFSRRTDAATVDCAVSRVRGPLPFGVRLD